LVTRTIERVDQNDAVLFLSKYRQLGGRTRATLQDGVDQSFAFLSDETPTNRVMLDSLTTGGSGDSAIFDPPPSVERTVTGLKPHHRTRRRRDPALGLQGGRGRPRPRPRGSAVAQDGGPDRIRRAGPLRGRDRLRPPGGHVPRAPNVHVSRRGDAARHEAHG